MFVCLSECIVVHFGEQSRMSWRWTSVVVVMVVVTTYETKKGYAEIACAIWSTTCIPWCGTDWYTQDQTVLQGFGWARDPGCLLKVTFQPWPRKKRWYSWKVTYSSNKVERSRRAWWSLGDEKDPEVCIEGIFEPVIAHWWGYSWVFAASAQEVKACL